MNKRIFVRKRESYRQEEQQLLKTLQEEVHLEIDQLEIYQIYDVYNIEEDLFEQVKHSVLSEVMINEAFEDVKLQDKCYFAFETQAAQYDQRADSAMQCIRLLDPSSQAFVRCGQLILFSRALTDLEFNELQSYLVNPIESQVKDMSQMNFSLDGQMKKEMDLTGFTSLHKEDLLNLKRKMNLSLNLEDLLYIRDHFRGEKRDPSETELYVLDCYWSDHCRHTTFETVLDRIEIESTLFKEEMQEALNQYLELRDTLHCAKPITLMDMASIVGKYHRRVLQDTQIEVSEEINACSFYVDLDHHGQVEKWLIQFKNETHNHPTEIEPFGGASTCIGGAIRDPLSGRSYVYQAMRVTGCGNVLKKREFTLPNKLSQSTISQKAAHGYSSYGNQIGLATTFVKELYDDDYVAKHMEVGAVVGANRVQDLKRESPEPGDIVVVIGGRTGRDGIQGASGSSLSHNDQSLYTMSSQVQKGNAPEERKIQRLFRNPQVSRLIKKCNDFGAGGVSVAIGELADGIEINLDRILVKYQGLNATELAISESQERMAVVLDPKDYDFFIKACEAENIEHFLVASVTDRQCLEMYFQGKKVVDLSAEFLDSAGVRQHRISVLRDNQERNPFKKVAFSKSKVIQELSSLNVASQKGLVTQFDASIGATTVLMPFAGKYAMTPVQASVQAVPSLDFESDIATVLTYGFIPKISHYSPFLMAIYSVLESVAKVYAVGGSKEQLYFSFQEYFEKLGEDSSKWGKVTQAMLGVLHAQMEIGHCAIGGKDSMSGSFNDIHVPETLISFACSTMKIKDVITPELKTLGNKLYMVDVIKDAKGFPNLQKTMAQYDLVHQGIQQGKIVSAYVLEAGSAFSALYKMSIGNQLGFQVNMEDVSCFQPGAMIVEACEDLDFRWIGRVSETIEVNQEVLDSKELREAYTSTFEKLYPTRHHEAESCETISLARKERMYSPESVDQVKVLIPVFPGTNCEYESAKAFEKEGAKVEFVIIRNKKETDISESIQEFVHHLEESHILYFVGGFSSGDEPDGSAKFIVNFLKNSQVKEAVMNHLVKKRLILGICNGFQALLKSGLLPYGEIRDLSQADLTLTTNASGRHISTNALTRVANTRSAWTQNFEVGQMHDVLFSHGEGKLVGELVEDFKDQVAFQYCDFDSQASLDSDYNPNGSSFAIEGMISKDGLILGKMGHSERYGSQLYKTNRLHEEQAIFKAGVDYFKGAQ